MAHGGTCALCGDFIRQFNILTRSHYVSFMLNFKIYIDTLCIQHSTLMRIISSYRKNHIFCSFQTVFAKSQKKKVREEKKLVRRASLSELLLQLHSTDADR